MKKLLILYFIFLFFKSLAQQLPCESITQPTTPMPTSGGLIDAGLIFKNANLKATFSQEKNVSTQINFAAFVTEPGDKLSFRKPQLNSFSLFLGDGFGFTDTGVPCPPPPPGKTCDQIGAILP